MSKLIELRRKLRSVSKINNMAKAMQVVAVSQLKQAQTRQRAASHFRKHFERLAKRLHVSVPREQEKAYPAVLLYIFGSDRGFCGAFNVNLLLTASGFMRRQMSLGKKVMPQIAGRKAFEVSKEGYIPVSAQFISTEKDPGFDRIRKMAEEASRLFLSGSVEKVYIFFNEFHSMLVQSPAFLHALPFDLSGVSVPEAPLIVEPSDAKVKKNVAADLLNALFYDAFMQTRLGEIASRLITMRGASENSKDMINDLNIKVNKARQSMITVELSEILSSFETLAEEEG